MKLFRERAGLAAVLFVTAAAIVGLAVLQYRWNREASEATGVRLADALQLSMVNWHLDLFRNLSEVCLTIRMAAEFSPQGDVNQFADRFAEWRSIARYPDLAADVYVIDRASPTSRPRTFQLNPGTGAFEDVAWPAALGALGGDVDTALTAALERPPEPRPDRQLTESFYNIGAALRDWRFEPAVPALIRSLSLDSAASRAAAGGRRAVQWLVIRLDEQVLRSRILPDLAHRYFQGTNGLDYEVAVVSGAPARRVIYASDPGFGEGEVVDADGRMNVFGRVSDEATLPPISIFHRTSDNRGPTAAVGVSWFPLLRPSPPEADWQLVVRHRRGGPLGAFVADMQRRGLALSFGALCLLVLSLSMLVITSIRAQRLARLQMDFVTAVSHELRTPLTIIGSAADNITSGVVETRTQLQEYGSVIGEQTSRLSGLVERVLLFASMREGHQRYVLQLLPPAEVVDTALASTEGLARAAHVAIERDIPPDLPPIIGERMAVAQCVENLITNAIKYSRDDRWVGIRARLGDEGKGERRVQISVSDRGIGIGPEDLPHIFEPFYRSPSVRRSQIHGTGLGLALAKQVAESIGGSLTVTSEPGRGSTFTLSLRCAESTVADQRAGSLDAPPFTTSLHPPRPTAG
ncbi:MAG: HAMP domain-containing histidine kinase [Acidobacteria bacterium]|nr:HAMP domain-containing histidine kinase [Acidobacteriota bacterium]